MFSKANPLSHSFNLSFTHSQHAEQLLFSCLCSKVTLSLSHSLTLSVFQSLIHSFSTCWTTFVSMSMLKNPSHFHTLTLSHSLIQSLSTCWTSFVFISMLKGHSHTHSHSFSLSHSFNLSFNHSRHAEQLLFSSLCSKLTLTLSPLQVNSVAEVYRVTLDPQVTLE